MNVQDLSSSSLEHRTLSRSLQYICILIITIGVWEKNVEFFNFQFRAFQSRVQLCGLGFPLLPQGDSSVLAVFKNKDIFSAAFIRNLLKIWFSRQEENLVEPVCEVEQKKPEVDIYERSYLFCKIFLAYRILKMFFEISYFLFNIFRRQFGTLDSQNVCDSQIVRGHILQDTKRWWNTIWRIFFRKEGGVPLNSTIFVKQEKFSYWSKNTLFLSHFSLFSALCGPFLATFGPSLSSYDAKTPFSALVGEIVRAFLLSVSTLFQPGYQATTICHNYQEQGYQMRWTWKTSVAARRGRSNP